MKTLTIKTIEFAILKHDIFSNNKQLYNYDDRVYLNILFTK